MGVAALLPGARLAAIGVLAAVLLAVLVPARTVARGRRRAGIEGLGAVLGLGAVGCVAAPGVGALALAAYLALWVLALVVWTRSAGQAATTVLALGAVALPYIGAVPLSVLGDAGALKVVLHGPLAFVCGSCAELDILRRGTLYQLLPAAQSSAYSYPSVFTGLAVPAVVAAIGWAGGALRQRLSQRLPAPAVAAIALLLVVGTPATADAQISPADAATAEGGSGIGDMTTRVRLGYYLPELQGYLRADGPNIAGDRLGLKDDLDLERIFLLPTFEVDIYWPDGGGIQIHYMEAVWKGEARGEFDLKFENNTLRRNNFYENKYRYRTIAFTEYLDVPITDWIKISIVTTQRYFKHEFRTRSVPDNRPSRDSMEGIIPSFGLAGDVLIWEVISAYGDIQWLDFTNSLFGSVDDDEKIKYKIREWKVGVRLELVEHAHISIEYFSLETTVAEGAAKYKQELRGARVLVAILF